MLRRIAAAVLAAALVSLPALPAPAQEDGFFERAERFLRRIGVQYAILAVRAQMDLTYESLSIDPRNNDAVLTGVRLWPRGMEDWECEVRIDRLRAGDLHDLSRLRSLVFVNGVTVPGACFETAGRAMLASFGFETIEVESMAVDLAYDFPSSAGSLGLQAAVRDAGDLSLAAEFDYVYFRAGGSAAPPVAADEDGENEDGDEDGDEGETEPEAGVGPAGPVAVLSSIELVFENDELFQRLEPLIAAQMGDPAAVPAFVAGALADGITGGGARPLTGEERAFLERLEAELERFVRDKDRLVIRGESERGVLLTDAGLANAGAVLAAMAPEVSATTRAERDLLPPDEIAAALGGGAGLDPAARLRIGRALATGEGAPRAPGAAAAVLAPLAEDWDGEANMLLARTLAEAGSVREAYAHALRAMAAGAPGAIGLGDELEARLDLAEVLALQDEAAAALPAAMAADTGALIGGAAIDAIRARAADLAAGSGAPRDYAGAWYWAALAGAAGDRVARALMSRLDASFAGEGPEGAAWAAARDAAGARALETWTAGFGAAVAAE